MIFPLYNFLKSFFTKKNNIIIDNNDNHNDNHKNNNINKNSIIEFYQNAFAFSLSSLVSVNLFVVEFNEILYVVVDGFNNVNKALINVGEL